MLGKPGGTVMKFYLVQLSYTADAWKQQLATPVAIERRLKVLDKMLGLLGARIVDVRGYDGDATIRGKFMSEGVDDLIAVLVFPSETEALAFSMAVSAEPGVRDIKMTPIMPLEDALKVMHTAARAREQSNYSAPGGGSHTWFGSRTKKAKAGRPATTRS